MENQPAGGRRLGAVMFTDVVGSSAMTSEDEGRGLKLIEQHATVLRDEFRKFNGRVVKTMGDGFLVEFASAVEAVNCAVEAQQELAKANAVKKQDEKVLVRIGIHVGDIVHADGDILGDAVNVAARLQPLAEPGGICVTRQVVDQVERKVGWKMTKMGTRELKNIRYPVELFKVEVRSGGMEQGSDGLDPRRIAILPFANLSADPGDRYFADGMTEELISTVSNIGELSVISRTSVMRYKDTTVPIGEIGRELSAGTVLEGSVRKAGNKVRVTTQLIDARSDRHIWAQSYDRDMTDIFAIQGDIAGQVADALRVKLVSKERQAIEKKATDNLEAYTLYLKGRQAWNDRSRDGLTRAVGYFKEAIAQDPNFALAYSGLADAYMIMEDRAFMPHKDAMPLALGYAQKAVELDQNLAEGHASMGLALEKKWSFFPAEGEFKRAIALKPSYATAQHWYSLLLGMLGKPEEAYEMEKKAFELDPHSSIIRQGMGVALLYSGHLDEAIAELDRVIEIDPDFGSAHYWKGWAHYQKGDAKEAVAALEKAVALGDEGSGVPLSSLAWVCLKTGQLEKGRKAAEEMKAIVGYLSPVALSIVKLGLGQMDEAFQLLEEGYDAHDSFLIYFREFPWFEEYRTDPRWAEIERKMGLPKV